MEIKVLASGSKGNSCLVKTKHHNILIDAGSTCKYITEALNYYNVDVKEIDYILITHTHKDHVSALKSFLKKNKPFLCISDLMYQDLEEVKNYEKILICDNNIILDDISVDIFKTSHDVSDSRGFIITEDNEKLVYVTDTGYLNTRLFKKLYNSNYYIIESNHDPKMLRDGKYPLWLQNRILSDYGHLSNEMTGTYLTKLIGPNTKKIVLAHLSAENNDEEVALDTIFNILRNNNIDFKNITCAKQFIEFKEKETV